MKSKIKKNKSLSTKVLKYLILFSVLILAFLWLFQVIFLGHYYEAMKTKEIKKVSKKIVNEITETNSFSSITEISFKTGICVEITDKNGYSLYEDAQQKKECLPSRHSSYYKYLFIRENNDNKIYHLTNPNFNNKTIIYSTKINDNMYLFLNTSLAPIDSTVKILISQLIYVTVGVLVVSLILAYFISQKITSPLVKINDSIKNGKRKL